MSEPIVFVDCETTGLDRERRRAWEVALIVRTEAGDVEHQFFVGVEDLHLEWAEPQGLKIGRFYERHPGYEAETDVKTEHQAAALIEYYTRGRHLVGAVPSFDEETFAGMLRRNGFAPAWHYHLIDVEALAVGYLQAKGYAFDLPWSSDALSHQLGIVVPENDRHTALGDARWARAIYDACRVGDVQSIKGD